MLSLFHILFLISSVSAFNYLVVSPGFGHSHSTFMGKVADALSDSGHNVTVLTILINSKFRDKSFTKSTKDIVYVDSNEELDRLTDLMESGDFSRFWTKEGSMLETIPSYQGFMKMFEMVYANLRQNLHILDELKTQRPKYDVIIFESFIFMAKAVQEYLEIPVFIPVTSVTHDNKFAELSGEPVNPSYLSGNRNSRDFEIISFSGYFTNFGNIMSFQERLTNTISYFLGKIILQYPKWTTLQDPTKPLEIETAYHRAPYIFINSNPYIDFPRPLLSKTIQVGGLTVNVNKLRAEKVDENWNKILDQRPHTVLVSFGSMFKAIYMPHSYKLSAFLTHGGLGSVNELSYLGKPAILCPLFADQLRNAKMLARHSGSIEITKFDLADYETLRSAIHRVLFDKSIAKNALSLAKRLENQPMKPKELLVRHAEFAAQFGEHHGLDCNIRNMSFIEYYLLDVTAFISAIAVFVVVLVFCFVRKVMGALGKLKND
ncbi:Protein CBR-UGT-41 [Caenorhabditis briggsae]|uniref:glucuronosyltransferase n=1 Tax=Caenorhabditis briggsae TaxID=6238 RepID=A8XUS0_CAEBR|nr:Protein CBR-UGT-41 [Caenorhabditis briggsae]CAP36395.2 Protein CBR-UGT-41 [Caenorhabditis briggsae]